MRVTIRAASLDDASPLAALFRSRARAARGRPARLLPGRPL